jgi:lipoate-protein ligase A
MALDQALLETSSVPLLRVYGWNQPHISIGYRHSLSELVGLPAWPIVRRWTGGGVVLHDNDCTYSLILPRSDAFSRKSSVDIYRELHGSLAQLLGEQQQLPYQIAPSDFEAGVRCFIGWSCSDILLYQRKVGGAGHRRCQWGLLHQGSLHCGQLSETFWQMVAQRWSTQVEQIYQLPAEILDRARQLQEQRYSNKEWLELRS